VREVNFLNISMNKLNFKLNEIKIIQLTRLNNIKSN